MKTVNDYINSKPISWLIAAIVEGSIGYETPATARRLIEAWKQGKRECYDERCVWVFGGDLEKALLHDFRYFERIAKDEQYAQKVISRVKRWMEIEAKDPTLGMELSMLYPTL